MQVCVLKISRNKDKSILHEQIKIPTTHRHVLFYSFYFTYFLSFWFDFLYSFKMFMLHI